MLIPCPSCKAQISGKPPKPGRYTPKCPKCGQPFLLIVPENADGTVHVKPMPVNPVSKPATAPTAGKATAPSRTAPAEATGEFTSPAADATGDFGPSSVGGQTEATGAFPPGPQGSDTHVEATGDFRPSSVGGATEATGDFRPRASLDATAAHTSADDPPPDSDGTTDFGEQAKPKPKKKAKKQATPDMPDQLGGYGVRKMLGQGGMGAVYLAQQLSLDRPVALKVMNPQWAEDPIFLARFVREAYAAAQLTHHNVVQIYDIGEDHGINFFSMEFVEGKSLGDVLRKNGKLEPAVAVGYILQAARGLKFAHDRGMVHRDVKPDNMMLNVEGLVKVADLGLVKTKGMTAEDDRGPEASGIGSASVSKIKAAASTEVTTAGTAMGSPSYMAPEQCRDAAHVDARADIYSLGCALYALLAGRAPFQGETAVEVMTKHLTEPPPPLGSVVRGLPKGLPELVHKALEKEPEDRYQSMDEFIGALKGWQDDQQAGPPRPTEEQIKAFEGLSAAMANVGTAKLAATLATVVPIAGLVAAVGLLAVKPMAGVGVFLAILFALVAGFVMSGTITGSVLFQKAREYVFGARILDWLTFAAAGVLFVAIVVMSGLIFPALIAAAAGTAAGAGFAFGLVGPAANERKKIKGEMDNVLKRLRLAGMEEDGVRKFVTEAAGDDWEVVYETLFGYPAKLQARAAMHEKGVRRPEYAGWRDKWVKKLDEAIEARAAARAQKRLTKLEAKRLEAEGMDAAEAKARAADAAEDLVEQAAELRKANADKRKKVNVREMMSRYDRAKLERIRKPRKTFIQKLPNKLLNLAFSPRLRLFAGGALILLSILWLKQAGNRELMLEPGQGDAQGQLVGLAKRLWDPPAGVKPLAVLPPAVGGLFNSAHPLAAGVLLVMSAFVGTKAIFLTWACAVLLVAWRPLTEMAGVTVPPVAGLTSAQVVLAAFGGVGLGSVILVRGGR